MGTQIQSSQPRSSQEAGDEGWEDEDKGGEVDDDPTQGQAAEQEDQPMSSPPHPQGGEDDKAQAMAAGEEEEEQEEAAQAQQSVPQQAEEGADMEGGGEGGDSGGEMGEQHAESEAGKYRTYCYHIKSRLHTNLICSCCHSCTHSRPGHPRSRTDGGDCDLDRHYLHYCWSSRSRCHQERRGSRGSIC